MQPTLKAQSKGFSIASGSSITPVELANAGFVMNDFFFHPIVELDALKQALPDFLIEDLSSPHQVSYRFDRLPF